MKKIIVTAAFVICMAGISNAQTTGGQSSGSTSTSESSSTTTRTTSAHGKKSHSTKGTKGKRTTGSATMNQRREYEGSSGQVATPTGQEATGVNGNEASNPKKRPAANGTKQ